MKESMGSTWIMSLMIGFIFIFTVFLILAMNFTKVYKMKNEVTTIIEKYEGATNKSSGGHLNWGSISIIGNYLNSNGYSATGYCPEDNTISDESTGLVGWYGANNLSDDSLVKAENNTKYYYCIRKHNINNTKLTYFEIVLFLKFDLPVIGNITAFKVNGNTTDIKNAYCTGLSGENKCIVKSN